MPLQDLAVLQGGNGWLPGRRMRLADQTMAFGLILNEIWKSKMEIPDERPFGAH
jgi:hypothetical protein